MRSAPLWTFGTPIVDIDFTANTDIIFNDNDGFLNDTDILTLLGTDGSTTQASGNDTVVADFTAAGDLANPLITAAIAGPRTSEQWAENLGALEQTWDPSDEAFLDDLVAVGHPSTPGYSDPAYEITGRPTGGD